MCYIGIGRRCRTQGATLQNGGDVVHKVRRYSSGGACPRHHRSRYRNVADKLGRHNGGDVRRSVSSHTGCDATSVGTSQTSCDVTMAETSHARCEAIGSLAASGFVPIGPSPPTDSRSSRGIQRRSFMKEKLSELWRCNGQSEL